MVISNPDKMNTLPVFFLAFANDPSNLLQSLKTERIDLEVKLLPIKQERLCELVIEPTATVEDIFRVFNQYKDRIAVFHFAGHSGSDGLLLETEGIVSQIADGGGLAQLFGLQKNLQLVFLNGCSNKAQVAQLQQQGIPNIIATNAAINDTAAVNFAKAFYQAIGSKSNLDEAFTNAEAYLATIGGSDNSSRALLWKKPPPENVFPWEKYFTKPDWSIIKGGAIYGDKPLIPVFMGFHPNDADSANELKKHLSILKRTGQITLTDSTQIHAGEDYDKELKRQLFNARIILIFISPDFMSSDETYEIEAIATERHKAGTAILIPIFCKEVDGIRGENLKPPADFPEFVRLRGLPDEFKKWFIDQWPDKNAAFAHCAKKIRELIDQLRS